MKSKIKNIIVASLFTAIICICSVLSFNLFGISFSLSLVGIFISSTMQATVYSLLSTSAYVIIGLIGVPIFANFNCGISAIIGPSGGFIMAYPLISVLIPLLNKYFGDSYIKNITYCSVSLIVCYLMGSLWYSNVYSCSFIQAATVCIFPFIIPDVVKIFLSCYIAKNIKKHIKK